MKFTGSIDELKDKLKVLVTERHAWRQLDNDHFRLKHSSGSSVDFYPSRNFLTFEGNPRFRKVIKTRVLELLGEKVEVEQLSPIESTSQLNASQDRPKVSYTPIHKESTVGLKKPPEKEYVTDLDSEIVIGLVSTVGTDTDAVTRVFKDRLTQFDYTTHEVRISRDIIEQFVDTSTMSPFDRINALMTTGNNLRKETKDFAFLAKAAVAKINEVRLLKKGVGKDLPPLRRKAFVVTSLKHPDEVQALRKIYSNGFFLVGIHASEERRIEYLHQEKDIDPKDGQILVNRDTKEREDWGQQTRDTFHLSDFFISFDGDLDKFNNDIWRTLDLIFGQPFVTPTFDEFAMFMAFSASLRSADLSRQVGAVVTRESNILSTGANDVPKPGGGLYWAEASADGKRIVDQPEGRDYVRGGDANVLERLNIIDGIVAKFAPEHQEMALSILKASRLKDITEYGRVVHAEMEALLACSRNGISTQQTHLYCTTFPCHNCAKHIIASGVKRVVYVEPYAKSKALEFHSDSIYMGKITDPNDKRVSFEAFVGVGPRSFFNLFSTNLGSGYKITRKDEDGKRISWEKRTARVRMQMLPSSYIEREAVVAIEYKEIMEEFNERTTKTAEQPRKN